MSERLPQVPPTRSEAGPATGPAAATADLATARELKSRAQDDTRDEVAARAHMQRVVQREPSAASIDPVQWAAAILAHLKPLPANRQWRVQRGRHAMLPVSALAPAVASRLTPEAGHRPQPKCPTSCFVTHAYDVVEVA